MEKIKSIIKKLWNFAFKTEKGLYLVFGGLTTFLSLIVFALFDCILNGEHYILSTIMQHTAGILFAYFTNRKFVFKSQNTTGKAKAQEATQFFATRIVTLFIDMGFKKLLIDVAGINNILTAVITSVIVVVLNYIASKLYIFKRKD